MEPNGVSTSRHRNSPSSERFLGVFPQPFPDSDNGTTDAGDELNEDDVFWIGGFSESNHRTGTPSTTYNRDQQSPRFQRPENFGILAVLPEDERMRRLGDHSVLHRKASISPVSTSSRMIPAIPKPTQSPHEREYSQSVPSVKYHQSAPVSVPVLPRAGASKNGRNRALFEVENEDADDEMLPPHEIVERGSSRSPSTTFSVLEGVGRTLKGRDLRRVRNAVLRQTGFLD